jgi:23S rRNA pseudoU1915 N3-methylase RlmH
MFRKFFAAIAASMLVVGGLFAEDVKAVFKSLDNNKIVVVVDGKDKTFSVDEKVAAKLKKLKDGDKVIVVVDGDTAKMVKKDK